jgi:hypothetical protein
MGAMFLVPRTQSGVVVHTNATSRLDTSDFSAQLLLAALLNIPAPAITPTLAQSVVKIQASWYTGLAAFLENCKTDDPPTHPLEDYAGTYWNALGSFKIEVTVAGLGLHVSFQGKLLMGYDLLPCNGDTFYWPASRGHELVDRGMWSAPFPPWHLVSFVTSETQVLGLTWQHERLMDEERFDK